MGEVWVQTSLVSRVEARAEISLPLDWVTPATGDIVCAQSRADITALLARLRAAEARAAEAEKVLLGGLGKPWSRVVDDAVRVLRGTEQ